MLPVPRRVRGALKRKEERAAQVEAEEQSAAHEEAQIEAQTARPEPPMEAPDPQLDQWLSPHRRQQRRPRMPMSRKV